MRTLILVTLLALAGCASPHGGTPEQNGFSVETTVITDLTLTPSVVHAGKTILLDYTLGKQVVFEDPRYGYDLWYRSPLLGASAGETLTLIADFYSPGDPQPTIEQARAALEALDYYDPAMVEEGLGFQPNGHFYALFKAPDTPQSVTLFFTVGASSGLTAIDETWLRTAIEVLP